MKKYYVFRGLFLLYVALCPRRDECISGVRPLSVATKGHTVAAAMASG